MARIAAADRAAMKDELRPRVALKRLPNRRPGIFATRLIRKGQLVVEEAPRSGGEPVLPQERLQMQASLSCGIPTSLWDSAASDIWDEYVTKATSPESQVIEICDDSDTALEAFDSQDSPREGVTVRIADAERSRHDSQGQSAFPLISCIQHSCLPNAHASWNAAQRKEVVYALRDIQPGEEILIAYVPLDNDAANRNAQLQERFGIGCSCEACRQPGILLGRSDVRRRRLADIDRAIPQLAEKHPARALRYVEEMVAILGAEKILDTSLRARAYYDAFQICLTNPDVGDAKHYARLAFQNYIVCRGPDSPTTLRLYGYVLNPEAHPVSQTSREYADALQRSPRTGDLSSLRPQSDSNGQSPSPTANCAALYRSRVTPHDGSVHMLRNAADLGPKQKQDVRGSNVGGTLTRDERKAANVHRDTTKAVLSEETKRPTAPQPCGEASPSRGDVSAKDISASFKLPAEHQIHVEAAGKNLRQKRRDRLPDVANVKPATISQKSKLWGQKLKSRLLGSKKRQQPGIPEPPPSDVLSSFATPVSDGQHCRQVEVDQETAGKSPTGKLVDAAATFRTKLDGKLRSSRHNEDTGLLSPFDPPSASVTEAKGGPWKLRLKASVDFAKRLWS